MQRRIGVFVRYVLVFSLAACAFSALADALTDRAKRLLEQKQPKQAYDLLLPQEGASVLSGFLQTENAVRMVSLEQSGDKSNFAKRKIIISSSNNTKRGCSITSTIASTQSFLIFARRNCAMQLSG